MKRSSALFIAVIVLGASCTAAAPASEAGASLGVRVTAVASTTTALTGQVIVGDLEIVSGGAWFLGDKGFRVTSNDGGAWRDAIPQGIADAQIAAIGASSASQAWLAVTNDTSGAAALETSDSGASWTSHDLPAGAYSDGDSIAAVRAISSTEAWFEVSTPLGTEHAGTLFHTIDGGASWSKTGMPAAGEISFGPGIGWAAVGPAHNRLFVTKDEGATWTQVTPPSPTTAANDYAVYSVPVLFGQAGLLGGTFYSPGTGDGVAAIYSTGDGGASWVLASSVPIHTSSGVPIDVVAPGTWFIGDQDNSSVLSTSDGGVTYETVLLPASPVSIEFQDARNGYVVATSVCPADVTKGAACGRLHLLHSADGLKSWDEEVP